MDRVECVRISHKVLIQVPVRILILQDSRTVLAVLAAGVQAWRDGWVQGSELMVCKACTYNAQGSSIVPCVQCFQKLRALFLDQGL